MEVLFSHSRALPGLLASLGPPGFQVLSPLSLTPLIVGACHTCGVCAFECNRSGAWPM